jgi:hypothetical protein
VHGDELDDEPVWLLTAFFPARGVLADVNPDQRGGTGEGRGELAPCCRGGQPAVGAGKANLRAVVRAHRKTYVSGRTGRPRWQDHLTFEIVPLGVAIACGWVRLKLPTAAAGGLIAVAAFLSVFLFVIRQRHGTRLRGFPP